MSGYEMPPLTPESARVLPFRRPSRAVRVRRRNPWLALGRHFAQALLLVGLPAVTALWLFTSPTFALSALDVAEHTFVERGWVERALAPLTGKNLLRLELILGPPGHGLTPERCGRFGAFVRPQADVVAIFGELGRIDHVAPAPQMPLADVRRGIACRFQHPRQRGGLRIEKVGHLASPIARHGLQVAGNLPAGWELPRDDAAARRRANRRRHIALLESHSLARDTRPR